MRPITAILTAILVGSLMASCLPAQQPYFGDMRQVPVFGTLRATQMPVFGVLRARRDAMIFVNARQQAMQQNDALRAIAHQSRMRQTARPIYLAPATNGWYSEPMLSPTAQNVIRYSSPAPAIPARHVDVNGRMGKHSRDSRPISNALSASADVQHMTVGH